MCEASDVSSLPTHLPKPAGTLPPGLGHWLGAAASLGLFAVAAFVMGRAVSELSFAELAAAMSETRGAQILAALLATAFSYLALVGYDLLALRRMGLRAPLGVVALASLAGNAFSFTLGLPLLTGAASRYWVYAKAGLTAGHVANITLFATLTFWLGMAALLGLGLILAAAPLSSIDHLPAAANFALGALLIGALALYAVWAWGGRRRVRLWGGAIDLPRPRVMLAQIALGVADIGCAAATLYVLLPAESQAVGFPALATLYVAAAIVGGISHAPGGVGVFEAFMLGALPAPSREALLAALLTFRAVYYVVPFLLAAALMALRGGRAPFAELAGMSRRWRVTG